MLKIIKHRSSDGVLTECYVQWQGYRASEGSWEPVAQANYLNTGMVQEYCAQKGLTLPDGLDLEVSDFSDSDVFEESEDEGGVLGDVANQGPNEAADDVLLAAQIAGEVQAASGADYEGEVVNEDQDVDSRDNQDSRDDGVHLTNDELDAIYNSIT